jgi:plastocyanin
MRMRSALPAIALSGLLVLVPACGSDDDSSEGATTSEAASAGPDLSSVSWTDETGKSEVALTARDNTFVARYVEVSPGTTVTWTNRGRTEHNVLPAEDGAFEGIDTADLEPGEEAAITFDEPGDYPYFCSLHGTKTKGMVGAIRVVEG